MNRETLRQASRDPRHLQLAVLSLLLGYGLLGLDFAVQLPQVAAIGGVALATQFAGTRALWRRGFDPRSAAITALSLCLLLRTDSVATAVLAAWFAVGSKFLLRVNGRHVFNPSAFGLVAALSLCDDAWLSAGQWGSGPLLVAGVVCLGSLVLRRAERSDVTWAFLAGYSSLVFGRALWLGDPLAIPAHALQSGSLLIFAFFMISDPKTLPSTRAGRSVFAAAVAAAGFFVQYGLFRTNGLLWSLVLLAPAVPVLDRVFPGSRRPSGGKPHAPQIDLVPGLPRLGAVR